MRSDGIAFCSYRFVSTHDLVGKVMQLFAIMLWRAFRLDGLIGSMEIVQINVLSPILSPNRLSLRWNRLKSAGTAVSDPDIITLALHYSAGLTDSKEIGVPPPYRERSRQRCVFWHTADEKQGGGYDLYGRLVTKHLGRFLPGHPNVIASNMPGAGAVIMANWLYKNRPERRHCNRLGTHSPRL